LVVLAHLRGGWSLRGREGFSTFCGSETPIFHCVRGEETEAKGSHWSDRTLNRTLDRTWLARPVIHPACREHAHRRVWPSPNCEACEVDWTRWRVRSRLTGRVRSQAGAYWKRPNASTVAFGLSCGVSGRWRTVVHDLCVRSLGDHWRVVTVGGSSGRA
jgi:hypothetical protein